MNFSPCGLVLSIAIATPTSTTSPALPQTIAGAIGTLATPELCVLGDDILTKIGSNKQ